MPLETHRRAIDSVAAQAGVSQPGLALVSFFGLRPDVRFDWSADLPRLGNQTANAEPGAGAGGSAVERGEARQHSVKLRVKSEE